MSKKMRDRKMKSKPICVLCDRYCKHGGNKRYNVGFTSGTAGYSFSPTAVRMGTFLCDKNGLLMRPDWSEEFILKPIGRHVSLIKSYGVPVMLHSDGNIREAVDILIDLGVAGLHPNEKGAQDIRAMKRDYGDRVCLLGNLDLNILGMGSPEDVDREVRELIRDVGPGGGYILTSGNSMASYLKPECVLAMSRAVKKYGRYPIELP